jgi:hypothetical protein
MKRIFGLVLGLMNKPDLLNRSFPTPLAAGEEGALSATSHNFRYIAWAVMIVYLINKYL